MVERVTSFDCPNGETQPSTCDQVPICKGCFSAQVLCGGGINEYYCANDECPRKPEENLRDLMNPALHRFRIVDMSQGETQESLNTWVHESFPEWSGPKGRSLAIIEEAVELALVVGLTSEEILSAVNLPIIKEAKRREDPDYVPEGPEGEVADIYLNVLAFAEEVGVDAKKALNHKMKINRSRPKEYYLEKTRLKKELGLKL